MFLIVCWKVIDKKQELDLRSSTLANLDEMYELWMEGKLHWTAVLTLRNESAGGGLRLANYKAEDPI